MTDYSIDPRLFDDFLAEISRGKTEATRLRYLRVMVRLRQFLDAVDVAPHLEVQTAVATARQGLMRSKPVPAAPLPTKHTSRKIGP